MEDELFIADISKIEELSNDAMWNVSLDKRVRPSAEPYKVHPDSHLIAIANRFRSGAGTTKRRKELKSRRQSHVNSTEQCDQLIEWNELREGLAHELHGKVEINSIKLKNAIKIRLSKTRECVVISRPISHEQNTQFDRIRSANCKQQSDKLKYENA